MSNRITSVDPSLTLLLANCANEAYYPTRHTPPPGYTYVDHWTGKNPSFFGGDVETYGLIFQNDADTSEYIFAFKGTATWWDAYEDIFVEKKIFKAHKNSNSGNEVEVAAGFMDIYSTDVPDQGSMQNQLMSFMIALTPRPTKVLITGHSLGSALAELFTLDLYVTYEGALPFTIQHYNFACPRVGGAGFASLYRKVESSNTPESRTVRIVNYWDEVPCLPPETITDYEHGPDYFLISFYKITSWPHLPHYEIRHSIYNYWKVLDQVVKAPGQKFHGVVTGLNDVQLESTIPDASKTECDSWFADELMDVALKMGARLTFGRILKALFKKIGSGL